MFHKFMRSSSRMQLQCKGGDRFRWRGRGRAAAGTLGGETLGNAWLMQNGESLGAVPRGIEGRHGYLKYVMVQPTDSCIA